MKYSRVVVKLGTNLLTGETDSLKEEIVASLVSQIASLRSNNLDILIVSFPQCIEVNKNNTIIKKESFVLSLSHTSENKPK